MHTTHTHTYASIYRYIHTQVLNSPSRICTLERIKFLFFFLQFLKSIYLTGKETEKDDRLTAMQRSLLLLHSPDASNN